MTGLLIRWLVLTVAVWASSLMPGIWYDDFSSIVIAALFLGILNALVKPILILVALPMVVISLGLFLFVINALLVWVLGADPLHLVPGFHVAGFWPAMGGSLIISLVTVFLGKRVARPRVQTSRQNGESVASGFGRTGHSAPPPGRGPIIDVEPIEEKEI
jgi:putative membrane protein